MINYVHVCCAPYALVFVYMERISYFLLHQQNYFNIKSRYGYVLSYDIIGSNGNMSTYCIILNEMK